MNSTIQVLVIEATDIIKDVYVSVFVRIYLGKEYGETSTKDPAFAYWKESVDFVVESLDDLLEFQLFGYVGEDPHPWPIGKGLLNVSAILALLKLDEVERTITLKHGPHTAGFLKVRVVEGGEDDSQLVKPEVVPKRGLVSVLEHTIPKRTPSERAMRPLAVSVSESPNSAKRKTIASIGSKVLSETLTEEYPDDSNNNNKPEKEKRVLRRPKHALSVSSVSSSSRDDGDMKKSWKAFSKSNSNRRNSNPPKFNLSGGKSKKSSTGDLFSPKTKKVNKKEKQTDELSSKANKKEKQTEESSSKQDDNAFANAPSEIKKSKPIQSSQTLPLDPNNNPKVAAKKSDMKHLFQRLASAREVRNGGKEELEQMLNANYSKKKKRKSSPSKTAQAKTY